MKWNELEGKYLRGVMPKDKDLYLFFKNEAIKLVSHNKDYSWRDNWDIAEVIPKEDWPERKSEYKVIGQEIQEVWTDGYDKDTSRIDADMDKWKDEVGEGKWGAKEGEHYTFIKIKTPMKTVELGTVYWDCHYPDTVWDVIK